MKTKKITKKYIREVLRTMNKTVIYKLYFQVNGKKASSWLDVAQFVEENAPTLAIYRAAYRIAQKSYVKPWDIALIQASNEYEKENPYSVELQRLRYQMAQGLDSYTKLPIMGKTHIYWCNPNYGHSDYNKRSTILIKGNERFCELLCSVAKKWYESQIISKEG